MKKYFDPAACVIFAIVVCCLYMPVVAGVFWAINSSDGLHLHLPRAMSIVRAVTAGRYPLWEPLYNLGQPYADGVNLFFHPAHILYFFLSPWLAHTISVILGLFFVFAGMFALLMHFGLDKRCSLIGALCYGLSGPVFFLHSYHLGWPAALLLPWGLFFLHRYDEAGGKRRFALCALAFLFLAHSCDADTAVYVLAAFAVDRALCIPAPGRIRYCVLWAGTACAAVLSAAAVYAPCIEWIRLSSRSFHNYATVLVPDPANVVFAFFSGAWLRKHPYDPAYFFIGAGACTLAAAGIKSISANAYMRRFCLFCLAPAVFFIVLLMLVKSGIVRQMSGDPWRPMLIFCLGLAIAAGHGSRALMTSIYPRWISAFIIAGAVLNAGVVAAGRASIPPSCGWNFTVENLGLQPALIQCRSVAMNIPYYARLAVAAGSGRCVMYGGTDNMTGIASLRTLINYAPMYNLGFERALQNDGLIGKNTVQPYWMELRDPDAGRLAVYGVRFLICLGGSVKNIPAGSGWVRRDYLSWPDHVVFENERYRGRAYLADEHGAYCGPADIVSESQDTVVVIAQPEQRSALVLADLSYPGWRVDVDGVPVAQSVFHGCLRSVDIKPGSHRITWSYSPLALQQTGAWICVCSLAVLIAAIACAP